MNDSLACFREIWLCDFEYRAPDGGRPEPHCLVAREQRSGRLQRIWADELARMPSPPFDTSSDALFVAYFASAELGCFRALGWPYPQRILDLYCEFCCLTNGRFRPTGTGLLDALVYYGLGAIAKEEKSAMRELAIRGGPFTKQERVELLDYCQSDVDALARLLDAMAPKLDLHSALFRGRYMGAVASMEWNGTPIDVATRDALLTHWDAIKGALVDRLDSHGVFVAEGPKLDPQTPFGVAILHAAGESGVDPQMLAEAARALHAEERAASRDFREAIAVARKATGLTRTKIDRWEREGRDCSTWPRLDEQARELAAEFPALGLGRGYAANDGRDETDYGGRLWEVLQDDAPKLRPAHDPQILAAAVDQIAGGDAPPRHKFSEQRFAEFLAREGIPWPKLPSGRLSLKDDTFREMARAYPEVATLRELRNSLGGMKLFRNLAIGPDGRNRCMLSPFRAKTSRNQPSNARFIFGPSAWLRSLIRPEPGQAIAYVDWSQQEFGVAGALSGDEAMMAAYESGDPYLAFAIQAGAAPPDATKATHAEVREQFKACVLAVQYGMQAQSLGERIGKPTPYARDLLRLHRETYPAYWKWSQGAVDHATMFGWLETVFGWRIHVEPNANARSLANFPMQANGAEMLRLACCLATERGIKVCAPVHDALLVEGAAEEIEEVVAATQSAMAEASRAVLAGFELRSDAKIVAHPDRYSDPRGEKMWTEAMRLLEEISSNLEYVQGDW